LHYEFRAFPASPELLGLFRSCKMRYARRSGMLKAYLRHDGQRKGTGAALAALMV